MWAPKRGGGHTVFRECGKAREHVLVVEMGGEDKVRVVGRGRGGII